MASKFRAVQLPDTLDEKAGAILAASDIKELSAVQELAALARHLFNVTPMETQQPGEGIKHVILKKTLQQGEPGITTPLCTRSIAIILDDINNGSIGIQVEESGKKNLTRLCCRRNTAFVLDEGVVIGLPKDGNPGEADEYPDSLTLLFVMVGYVDK